MIFSYKTFNDRTKKALQIHPNTYDSSTHHNSAPDDFAPIAAYKIIISGVCDVSYEAVIRHRKLTVRYRDEWKKYNHTTRSNLYNLYHIHMKFYKIPYYQKNLALTLENIHKLTRNLGYVPDDLMTPSHLFVADKYGGYMLAYVPDRLKTHDMIRKRIVTNEKLFDFVPDSMLTPEFIIELISINEDVIYYIPDYLKTPEVNKVIDVYDRYH